MAMTNDNVILKWARGESGRGSWARCNVSFDGPSLFSYSAEIARHLESGQTWITTQKHFVTTTRHTSEAVRVTHGRVIRAELCPSLEGARELSAQWTDYARLLGTRADGTLINEVRPSHEALKNALATLESAGCPDLSSDNYQAIVCRVFASRKISPPVLSWQLVGPCSRLCDGVLQVTPAESRAQSVLNVLHASALWAWGGGAPYGARFESRLAKVLKLALEELRK